MEMHDLVKVKVRTLDADADPIVVTVASKEGKVSGEQVFKKVCDMLGLKSSSRAYFALFDRKDQPTIRYRHKEDIPVTNSEVCVGKWCFVGSEEKDLLHQDPAAAHLLFLQAQHDVNSGKYQLSEDEKQKLDECLEPGFVAEDQFVLLCQRQATYNSLWVPHCRLTAALSVHNATLAGGTTVSVFVSKYGVKLVTASSSNPPISFTWFEVVSWTMNQEETTLTFAWQPDAMQGPSSDVPLHSPQVKVLLAGILEMITILQKSDKSGSGASFHTEMIKVGEDGCTVWENGLYSPERARQVHYQV